MNLIETETESTCPTEHVSDDQKGMTITFSNCARCGGDHSEIPIYSFTNPCNKYTHWATCPITLEPIMVQYVD